VRGVGGVWCVLGGGGGLLGGLRGCYSLAGLLSAVVAVCLLADTRRPLPAVSFSGDRFHFAPMAVRMSQAGMVVVGEWSLSLFRCRGRIKVNLKSAAPPTIRNTQNFS